MLSVRKGFNIKKLKFWGFKETKTSNEWYLNLDESGMLYIFVDVNREVHINYDTAEPSELVENIEYWQDIITYFPKEVFDLIKAEVFVWRY